MDNMLIDRIIEPYIVLEDDSLDYAVRKIDKNKCRFVLSVTAGGVATGILTDGDFRRWLLSGVKVDMSLPVKVATNPNFKSASIQDDVEKLKKYLNDQIHFLPLLDSRGKISRILRRSRPDEGLRIGNFEISPNSPCFIISEIGLNHNGSFDRAKNLIEKSKEAGANCAKFQMRDLTSLYRDTGSNHGKGEDLGVQYTFNLLNRFELETDEMIKLFDYCKELDITPLCTPWESSSYKVLEDYGMDAYKIASADMTNLPFLKILAESHKPLLMSTGMSTESEISTSTKLLKKTGCPFILLHCNSTYPPPMKDVHLNYLKKLEQLGSGIVGYSGHERGIYVPIAAVTLGAKIIEKHITLDKDWEGNDHKVSLLPEEFSEMVSAIRNVEEAMGDGSTRTPTQGEIMNRANLAKSIIAGRKILKGQKICSQDIIIKSPGKGLQPNRLQDLLGKKANRDIGVGDYFFESDLRENSFKARSYHPKRKWGVPVRWHDFKTLSKKSNPDFLEFHISFKDMDEDYENYFEDSYEMDFMVHSPDVFSGDHLLDLSNPSKSHRQRSIDELQRVVDLTQNLKTYFPKTTSPLIIASLGGFTKDGFLSPEEIKFRYDNLWHSYQKLDCSGVEIIGQTLPPFPWYFGGQLYLNLFVNADDTVAFCNETGLRLCLDISHSMLACRHYKSSFHDFIEKVSKYAAHLHIADSEGVDGEGIQIEEGEIDFIALSKQLDNLCPEASFIPEIWQGHKNEGEGFWIAMNRLEKNF